MSSRNVIVIGAGPAGLTAAYELLKGSDCKVTVLEASGEIGGLSKTVNHHGNRIDIGGHRFFSKSDWVMNWWQDILPIESAQTGEQIQIAYQNKQRTFVPNIDTQTDTNQVLLVRNRLSRIFHHGKFFSYPMKANLDTALKLGPATMSRMLASYGLARAFPRTPEISLEDFLINRFGTELYRTFFRGYTEKVWGVPCTQISAEWGAQRIKGLSVTNAVLHALKSPFQALGHEFSNKEKNTSLIEKFLYPKFGPGQMWETVAKKIKELGGELRLRQNVVGIGRIENRVTMVTAQDPRSGEQTRLHADYVISTMPISDLITAMRPAVPQDVDSIANRLEYRDFITVGLLLKKLRKTSGSMKDSSINMVPDNWIYIQDGGTAVGRLQFFNNWSPHLVADPDTAWVGMEYFCQESGGLWTMNDSQMIEMAAAELEKLGLADRTDLLDGVVLRIPKAYPGYYGAYNEFGKVRNFTDSISNLFLIGRNGMHRYNNQDHSMLTAHHAVQAILKRDQFKEKIWAVNIDDDYHEENAVA